MELRAIHHVAVTVADLDRSIAFYCDTLGLPLTLEPTPWSEEDPQLDLAVGLSGAKMRAAIVRVGELSGIELQEYAAPSPEAVTIPPQNVPGAGHVCFLVDDIEATKRSLEAAGVSFRGEVEDIDVGPMAGWRWIFFTDPDGYLLELVELVHTNEAERREAVARYLEAKRT